MGPIKIMLAIVMAMLLAACATTQPPEPPQTRNLLIVPSAALTKDCSISPPPAVAEYVAANDKKRIELLHATIVRNQGDVKKCNEQWKALRVWYEEQTRIHTGAKITPPPPLAKEDPKVAP